MSTAVHITWHGAQINFGDPPPYLTYAIFLYLGSICRQGGGAEKWCHVLLWRVAEHRTVLQTRRYFGCPKNNLRSQPNLQVSFHGRLKKVSNFLKSSYLDPQNDLFWMYTEVTFSNHSEIDLQIFWRVNKWSYEIGQQKDFPETVNTGHQIKGVYMYVNNNDFN